MIATTNDYLTGNAISSERTTKNQSSTSISNANEKTTLSETRKDSATASWSSIENQMMIATKYRNETLNLMLMLIANHFAIECETDSVIETMSEIDSPRLKRIVNAIANRTWISNET